MKKIIDKYFSVVKKFIPEQEEKSLVGLDIGINSCKMVELKADSNSYKLINWAIEPVTINGHEQVITSLLSKLKFPTNNPITAVGGKGTLIRYIDMARMSIDDLRKSFSLEADKYFPFPADQIYTDCFIVDPKADDNKMSVLVASAKKEIVDARVQLLTKLGLQTNFIALNPIALVNVFDVLGKKATEENNNDKDRTSVVAVLDMGETVSNLTVMDGNLPRFTRDVFIGGREFTRNVSNALDISFEEAEKLRGNPGDQTKEVVDASEAAVSNLVSELRLSFDYFITEKNITINKLLLTGGASMTMEIIDVFSKYLEMPVEKWDPLSCLSLGPDVDEEEIKQNAGRLGVAIGLALYS